MIRRPPRSTLFPTRRSSDLDTSIVGDISCVRRVAGRGCAVAGRKRSEAVTYTVHTKIMTPVRSEEHTSELQSQSNLVCRLLLEKKKKKKKIKHNTKT